MFSGCSSASKNRYEAVILNDNASEIINTAFYEHNYTYGAYYDNGDSLQDSSLPKSRIFIIKTQEEYENIMVSDANLDINFADEIIIVYTYTSDYVRDVKIDNIGVIDDDLSIELSLKKPPKGVGDSVQPFQRYVVLKMKKTEFSNVNITID